MSDTLLPVEVCCGGNCLSEHSQDEQCAEAPKREFHPSEFDAYKWADEWLRVTSLNPAIPNDRETMMAWFANAIMAGYDKGYLRGMSHMKEKAKVVIDSM